ncbi:hypothetical protein CRUP_003020 [Coryphaenoides rupestris]|nr:hypothetical protein CRUP_003020 [Coryphaenoides rupestris]
MALPWTGGGREDLNAGNDEFMCDNTSNEMDLMKADLEGVMMNTQSCMDHSIRAIFEDSTAASEDKIDVERESESSLLTALTEILDSVEDDGGTLSPFDTLPDSEYLKERKDRNTLSRRSDREGGGRYASRWRGSGVHSQPHQKAIHCTASLQVRAETDTGWFSSSSLVDLVRLMHPYCLQVHLEEEEGGKLWPRMTAASSCSSSSRPDTSPTPLLPSQGEILKYVKPSGDSDEEVDVDLLDDDDAEDNEAMGGGVGESECRCCEGQQRTSDAEATPPKSALVTRDVATRQPAKEKKRVSFGPVQVISIGESDPGEPTSGEEETAQTAAALSPVDGTEAADASPESLTAPACGHRDRPAEVTVNAAAAAPLSQGPVKPKSLSLQQYRQLRQKRLPLVETQGNNNTTKWPLLSEAPKELPPFQCLQGATRTHRDTTSTQSGGGKAAHGPPASSSGGHHRRLKRSRTDLKAMSVACPVRDCATVVENKTVAVSSDPPNPVFLPLPAARPAASRANGPPVPSVPLCSAGPSPLCSAGPTPLGSAGPAPLGSAGPTPSVLPSAGLLHEIRKQLAKMEQYSTTTLAPPNQNPNSESTGRKSMVDVSQRGAEHQPLQCPATHTAVTSEMRTPPSAGSTQRPVEETEPLPKTLSPGDASGDSAKVNLSLQEGTSGNGSEEPLTLQTDSCSSGTVEIAQSLPPPSGPALPDLNLDAPHTPNPDVPSHGIPSLPPSTDSPVSMVSTQDQAPDTRQRKPPPPLSTQRRQQPFKAKNPGSRSIQIIEPQPLPYKKMQSPSKPATGQAPQPSSSFSTSHVTSDHDYCAPQDLAVSPAAAGWRGQRDASTPAVDRTSHPRTSSQANGPSKRVDTPENRRAASHTTLPPDPAFSPGAELDYCSVEDGAKRRIFAPPPPSPPQRGREKRTARRYRKSRHSDSGSNSPSSSSSSTSSQSSSSSSSSSGSPSPSRKRYCRRRSGSSSCSSSSSGSRSPPRRYHFTYSRSRSSRSRSKSWSQSRSRSRSRSPRNHRRRWRAEMLYRSKEARRHQRRQEMRIHKLKAIDERRVVYVGRIRRTMTHDELRERFALIGEDAFAAIENGSKLRQPDELPFDICFGGRRQFCKSDYADLDSTKDEEAHQFDVLDFDSLLKQAQKGAQS